MSDETEYETQRMIDFKCPYCGDSVSFPEMDAASAQECPFCMGVLIVPRESCDIGRKFPLPVSTPRLILRRLASGDVDALSLWVEDKELLAHYLLPIQDAQGVPDWLEWDAKVQLSRLSPVLFLMIELRDSEKPIGLVSIKYSSGDFQPPEVEVMVDRNEQRKGYGTEALRGLLEFGFRDLNLRRITAHCYSQNAAFIGLAAKVGLRQEGAAFEDRYFGDKWVNTAYFAILQSEYESAVPRSS